jgi:hypothetical protein
MRGRSLVLTVFLCFGCRPYSIDDSPNASTMIDLGTFLRSNGWDSVASNGTPPELGDIARRTSPETFTVEQNLFECAGTGVQLKQKYASHDLASLLFKTYAVREELASVFEIAFPNKRDVVGAAVKLEDIQVISIPVSIARGWASDNVVAYQECRRAIKNNQDASVINELLIATTVTIIPLDDSHKRVHVTLADISGNLKMNVSDIGGVLVIKSARVVLGMRGVPVVALTRDSAPLEGK